LRGSIASGAGDADDSGEIELTDAVLTAGFLFLGEAPPPSPGLFECGLDPTSDELDCLSSPPCSAD
jgi:hypothetical protein